MSRVTINLTPDAAEGLRLLSKRTAVKRAALIRMAIFIGLPAIIRNVAPVQPPSAPQAKGKGGAA